MKSVDNLEFNKKLHAYGYPFNKRKINEFIPKIKKVKPVRNLNFY
jgi:hypothetical protein